MKKYRFLLLLVTSVMMLFIFIANTNETGNLKKPKSQLLTERTDEFKNIKRIALNKMPPNQLPDFSTSRKKQAGAGSIKIEASSIALNGTPREIKKFHRSGNGTVGFLHGKLGKSYKYAELKKTAIKSNLGLSASAKSDVTAAINWMNELSRELGLAKASEEFLFKSYHKDNLGKRHIKLKQFYKGIPVWAEEAYVHIDENDEIYAFNGSYEKTPKGINLESNLNEEKALELTIDHFKKLKLWKPIDQKIKKQLDINDPKAQKVIWYDENSTPHLVWFVDIYANLMDWYYVFVDASTGKILNKIKNTAKNGFVDASGTDLYGVTQNFRAYQQDNLYILMSDVNNMRSTPGQLPENIIGGLAVQDAEQRSGSYDIVTDDKDQWEDSSAVSAMVHVEQSLQYFENTFGRQGFDDSSSTSYVYVNVKRNGFPMDNGYWNGKAIFLGNGRDIFYPIAGSLDFVAHEFAHGVISTTANLVYQGESGALNESFADFFGCMIDRDDWLMFDDIMRPGRGIAARDMENPANSELLQPQPSNMDEYQSIVHDHGGVHINSGITNRAAVIVAKEIGREKTEQIYYRALTTYLLRQSLFIDLRYALEQSARDLYGETEVNAISNAFDIVKITGDQTDPRDFLVNPVEGEQFIAYVREDADIGLINIAQESHHHLEGLTVRSEEGFYSQLSVTADGSFIYFVNENGFIEIADLREFQSNGNYSSVVLDSLYVETPGDIWNVAVRRDNAMFAFTSHYANDNFIYFNIDDELYYLELQMPTTAESIYQNTLKYPDVIDWSPNVEFPKLAFDAYNELDETSEEDLEWWIIGEVDLSSDSLITSELHSGSPDNWDYGNIQYSSTNPLHFSFTAINKIQDISYIFIKDFSNINPGNTYSNTEKKLGRTSFNADDSQLFVQNNTDRTELIFISPHFLFGGSISNIPGNIYNFESFILNTVTGIKEENSNSLPEQYQLAQNYPNPFNPATIISYSIPETGHVKLVVYDILGRELETLVDETKNSGNYEVTFNSHYLSSGLYIYKLEAGNFAAHKKMLLIK